MKMWMARQKSGCLDLFNNKPTLETWWTDHEIWVSQNYDVEAPDYLLIYSPYEKTNDEACIEFVDFPEITFENSPVEVELTSKQYTNDYF